MIEMAVQVVEQPGIGSEKKGGFSRCFLGYRPSARRRWSKQSRVETVEIGCFKAKVVRAREKKMRKGRGI